jgi:hypothetical protein
MSVIDTSESFRSVMDSILLKPIGRSMGNPLSLALMITSVIMLVVVYSYDDQHVFRTSLRIFGITTAFLFIGNHILINDINARQLNPDQQNVIRILERGNPAAPGYNTAGGAAAGADDESDGDDEPMVVSRSGASNNAHILERLPDASSLVVHA